MDSSEVPIEKAYEMRAPGWCQLGTWAAITLSTASKGPPPNNVHDVVIIRAGHQVAITRSNSRRALTGFLQVTTLTGDKREMNGVFLMDCDEVV